jgi:hypothetical protein
VEELEKDEVKELVDSIMKTLGGGFSSFIPTDNRKEMIELNLSTFSYLIGLLAEIKAFNSEFVDSFSNNKEERQKLIRENLEKADASDWFKSMYLMLDSYCVGLLKDAKVYLERTE